MSHRNIYTVGHSTRTQQELATILADSGVELLVDVRAFPSSRRHPQFNSTALAQWLPEAGIAYRHTRALGGRRRPIANSANGGWREAAFKGYADYMATEEFRQALAELEAAATERHTAVMCAEAVWWRCHRRLISDALVVRGWRVEHLGIGESHAIHELPAFARVAPDKTITYPPLHGTLLE